MAADRRRRFQGRCCTMALASVAWVAALSLLGIDLKAAWCGAHGATSRRSLLASASGTALLGAAAGPAAAQQRLTPEELSVNALYRRTSPGVLSISAVVPSADDSASPRKEDEKKILGSGFAWDRNHVITTYSMMKGVQRPRVVALDTAKDGKEIRKTWNAAIVGADPVSDVAVLWVEGDMKPLRRGSTEDLSVGQDVYAIGNPFGLEHSLSKGVVSGVSRTMDGLMGRPIQGVIQTDASINPGNNGGPLLDSTGSVIGVNNAIMTGSGSNSGVGMAVPIEAIERSVTSLILEGKVRWPSLGVTLSSDALTQELGLSGVMVKKVAEGSPAEIAGIKPMRAGLVGDIIVGIDSSPVSSTREFFRALDGRRPGEDVELQLMSAGGDPTASDMERRIVRLKLGGRVLL